MTVLLHDDDRRRDLAQFLKDRRGRISPSAVGVTAGARRRARGLLREEVAMIAGVGVTWYTWLEQARPIKPSVHVLGHIARALRLDDAERTHLFRLARPDLEPAPSLRLATTVSPALLRTMESLAPNPAYAVNALWEVVGWNTAAVRVFGDFARFDAQRRNLLYRIFCDPDWRGLFQDRESISASAVAQFRAGTARLNGDARLKSLLDLLERESSAFCEHWRRRDVRQPASRSKVLQHPRLGRLDLEYATFQPDGEPDVRLTIYTPADVESARRIRKLSRSAEARA
jgi:transcriptional regulator with XRE-family HTH domain